MSATGPDLPRESAPEEVQVVWVDHGGQPPSGPGKKPLLIGGAAVVALAAIITAVVLNQSPTTSTTAAPPSSAPTASEVPGSTQPTGPSETAPSGTDPTAALPSFSQAPTSTDEQPDFSAASSAAKSAVVRVLASTCQGTGVGTGFWIDANTVMTSYPSVSQSVSTVVVGADGPMAATVIGADPASGVALLSTDRPGPGSFLSPQSASPVEGDWLAVVGLPSRQDKPVVRAGQVSQTGVRFRNHGVPITGLAALPGALDMALGGAPVVNADGAMVGAVYAISKEPRRLVVPADRLVAGLEAARVSGRPEKATCRYPTGPHSQTAIENSASAPPALVKDLKGYFVGINRADWAKALAAMTPAQRRKLGNFSAPTTYDFNIRVRSARSTSSGYRAWVTFDSLQSAKHTPGESGYTCASWSINYSFVPDGDRLKINGTTAHGGRSQSWTSC